ncbi:unnamed protein product [Sphagnum jensenii]|uniref:Uncharacterized protein n=1 Tax=Sphagnum jensenii TaxID=128206 RepID=A0ABP1A7Q1_9BRYO
MNTMVEAIKVLQTLMVSERETNMQLSLELKEAQKEKGLGPSMEATKAMKTQMLDAFMGKYTKAKKVKLNERFTPHNQILKDGQEFLSLHQSNAP